MDPLNVRPADYPIALAPAHHSSANPTHNCKGRHAWIIVGTETLFACHLMMGWMQGHNYEAILEIELPEKVKEKLLDDRSKTGRSHFLANQTAPDPNGEHQGHEEHGGGPRTHSIPDLQTARVTNFTADVWNYFPLEPHTLEWPYPPGSEFIGDFEVEVKKVVHFRHINPNIVAQRFESYVLFGKGKEAHIAHQIVDQPDYDHVATLAEVPDWLQTEQLGSGVVLAFPDLPWTADRTRCSNPFPNGDSQRVLYQGIRRYRDPAGKNPELFVDVPPLDIRVQRSWWFSTRIVNFLEEQPCGGLGDIPRPEHHPTLATPEP